MDASQLDKELGLLVRRAINSGLEPVIVSGLLIQNCFEVANHTRMRSEAMVNQEMKKQIRKAFETPNPDGPKEDGVGGN